MSILTTITRLAFDYRARRRRLAVVRQVAQLPSVIRADIGWPDPGTEPGPSSRSRRR